MTNAAPDQPESLLDANVQTISELSAHVRERTHTRLHQPIERWLGIMARPTTLYVLTGLIVLWMLLNAGKDRPDPPPFSFLNTTLASLSLLTTVAILIVQAREGQLARERAELELQINLLAEQKVAKLIALVEELRHDLPGVPDREDPQARAMQEGANPASVLNALERREGQ